ncbi:MAG: hypothetical protein ACRERE_38565 [Candidatus Entotheonellia bacterium]
MRRLKPPTLVQWGCPHRWREQSSKPQGDKLHRLRYYFCQQCELRAKTREVPEVPWEEGDLVALVKTLLPEGKRVSLRDKGMTELPLDGLNTILARHELMIYATKGSDPRRMVTCTLTDGRRTRYELFELRQIPHEVQGRTSGATETTIDPSRDHV